MPTERNNINLPALFREVVTNIEKYNTPVQQQKRITYARYHSYVSNLQKIASYL
jgi:hypothetical protein